MSAAVEALLLVRLRELAFTALSLLAEGQPVKAGQVIEALDEECAITLHQRCKDEAAYNRPDHVERSPPPRDAYSIIANRFGPN